MKKIINIFILLFFINFIAFGQVSSDKVDIQWSLVRQVDHNLSISDIIGSDETGFYVAKKLKQGKKSQYKIEHYDLQMKPLEHCEIEYNWKGRRGTKRPEFVISSQDKLHFFSSHRNVELSINTLSVQSIDKKSLQINPEIRKIGDLAYPQSIYFFGKFAHQFSDDSSRL